MEYKFLLTFFYLLSGLRPGFQTGSHLQSPVVRPQYFVPVSTSKKKEPDYLASEEAEGLAQHDGSEVYSIYAVSRLSACRLVKRLFYGDQNPCRNARQILTGVSVQPALRTIITAAQAGHDNEPGGQFYHRHWTVRKLGYRSGWALLLLGLSFLTSYLAAANLRAKRNSRKYRDQLAEARVENFRHAILLLNNAKKGIERKHWLHTHLLASISHDIRTPLGFVGTTVGEIKQLLESNQRKRAFEAVDVISYTVKEIVNLTENLTLFIKSSLQGGQVEQASINLKELLLQKTKMFDHILAVQNGHLSVEVPENIIITTNPDLLGILIHNLIDNALKVRRDNHIRIFTVTDSGKIQLVVSDLGPGMPANIIKWLSSETQLQKIPEKKPSLRIGLGLILVKEISQMLGIKVSVDNLPGAHISLQFDR